MNNKEKLYLVKQALNERQRGFLGGFPTRSRGTDSKYRESVAEDNRRSEQIAAQHRRQSEAAKQPRPTQYTSPMTPARKFDSGMDRLAQAAQPANPAPWHNSYVDPNQAKIQQGVNKGNQLMSDFNKQFSQPKPPSLGVPSKPRGSSNQLAFNVNSPGNFTPNR